MQVSVSIATYNLMHFNEFNFLELLDLSHASFCITFLLI
jgi:hypothetical protein